MKMRTLNSHLLDDKIDDAMTHYINSHPQNDTVHVDASSLSLNVQEDPGGRVLTVMHQQPFQQQICRQVSVTEVGDGQWGEELMDPESRLAAIVAQLAQNSRHHHTQGTHLKVTSTRGDVDSSVILDAPLRLFNGQTLEQQTESLVVQSIAPLPPLQDMKRGQETDWFNNKTKVTHKDETIVETSTASGGRSVSRRSLPHKKRISRRLRRHPPHHQDLVMIDCNSEVPQEEILPDNFVTVSQEQLAHDTQHITHEVRPILICQLCGEFYGEDQVKFYNHLKQHYEGHTTIIIENPVADLGIDKMTNTCIVDNSSALPDSLVELTLEDSLPKTTIYQSQIMDKNVLYSTSDKALNVYSKAHYSMANVDKESAPDPVKLGELNTLKSVVCPRCPRTFRKQRLLDEHIKETHNKLVEEMCEFSEPEDLMEGITVSVEEPLDLPTLTVDNGHVHQDHSRHWYLRGGGAGGGGGGCGGESGECPVCVRPAHTHSHHHAHNAPPFKEEVLNRILEVEVELPPPPPPLPGGPSSPLQEQNNDQIHTHQDMPAIKQEPKKSKKSYQCSDCGRDFSHRNSLVYHMLSHRATRPHPCTSCNKAFYTANALKIHVRTHNDEKPERCEKCGRMFRQWSDLKYHITSIHSNLKAHKCDFCGKEFARKYSLIVHRRIHTGEKNYKCEICTKTFSTSSYRIAHMKTHTGEKPFKCEICTKGFRDSGDLKRHVKIHNKAPGAKKQTKNKGKKQTENIEDKIKIEDEKVSEQNSSTQKQKLNLLAGKTVKKQNKKIKKTIELPKHEAFKTSELCNVEVLDSKVLHKYKEVYNDNNIIVTEINQEKRETEKLKDEREFATLKPMFKPFEVEKTLFQNRNENTDGKMQVYTHVESKRDFVNINDLPLRSNIEIRDRNDIPGDIENTFFERLTAMYNIQSV